MRSFLLGATTTILLAVYPAVCFAVEQNPNQTVGEFVATCSKVKHIPHQRDSDEYVNCENMMMFSEMAPDYCPPSDRAADTLADTLRWLQRRPDMASMKATTGILIALKAMYCR
jgi:hypothetical protein